MTLNPDVNYTNFVSHFDKFITEYLLTANNLPAIHITRAYDIIITFNDFIPCVCEARQYEMWK